MTIRYTAEDLIKLKESPLVTKPPGLPPAEQWMGPPVDQARNTTRPAGDKCRNDSSALLDHPNRRPGVERHISRPSANPEEIILGPPRTSFTSATSSRNNRNFDSSDRLASRDTDSRDRLPFRGKGGDGDNERTRDGRMNLRARHTEGDQDSEGWSTVKPRKSFGSEGAERFNNGRMGGDRHREDRIFRDREDREEKDRPSRGFNNYSRDKEGEDDGPRRNCNGRGRNEPSWFRDDGPPTPKERTSNGDRYADRSRGWREKDHDDRGGLGDRGDRRWDRDRDQRQEREPEWMDEPADVKPQVHTQEDFQKWKEQMQSRDNSAIKEPEVPKPDISGQSSFFGLEKPKSEAPIPLDTGPDKFFGMWATPKEENGPQAGVEAKKEGITKAKTTAKASRFTSFFAPQEEVPRRQTEPPPSAKGPAPTNGFDSLLQGNNAQSSAEKEAFQQLLSKLHRQHEAGTTSTPPGSATFKPPPPQEKHSNPVPAPETYQQFRPDRPEEARPQSTRNTQPPGLQELLHQRQMTGSQPTARPDQILQDLMIKRQSAQSQTSARPEPDDRRNSNTDFLMGLMQSAKAAPEPQRAEQLMLRLAGPQAKQLQQFQQQQILEREKELQREMAARRESNAQRRPQAPPGFFDDPSVSALRGPGPPPNHETPNNRSNAPNQQPTHILQRPPPPPGLEQMPPNWGQGPPPPPPGLARGPPPPMPQQMFPPGFPMGNFPTPEMVGPPPGPPGRMQPPLGFFSAPPPGFLPPGFQGGPDGGLAFGADGLFDGRGPPPPAQGGFRRQ